MGRRADRPPKPGPEYLWCSGYSPAGQQGHWDLPDEFGLDRYQPRRDFKQPRCRDCTKIRDVTHNPANYGKYQDRFERYRDKKKGWGLPHKITWKALVARFGWVCHICQKPITDAKYGCREHVWSDGPTQWWNMKPAHKKCNNRKNHHTMWELWLDGILQQMRSSEYEPEA